MTTGRHAVASIGASLIREVSVAGAGIEGVLPLWFGEPDEVTPGFIRDAAKASLDAGETFYNSNLGIAPLRAAIAAYHQRLGRHATEDQVCATASGMQGIMLAAQAILDPGDKVALLAPHWPNLGAVPQILSADVTTVPLRMEQGLWRADMDRLLAVIQPGLKLLLLNSPGNPTGVTLSSAEQQAILDRCRQTGTWILADEVYERLYYEGPAAPSFLDLASPEDRVVSVNSFSKSWAMTGWRLGWLVVPPALMDALAKLVEYNNSCSPLFVQRAGIAAIEHGEDFVTTTTARYKAMRDLAAARLNAMPGITAPVAQGGMYNFFRVEGCTDSLAMAKRMLVQARVGIAPGAAFGPGGEGHFRLCFAQSEAKLSEALDRLQGFFERG